jgi:hypothetical protein
VCDPQDGRLAYLRKADCVLALLTSQCSAWSLEASESAAHSLLHEVYAVMVTVVGPVQFASVMANPNQRPIRLKLQVWRRAARWRHLPCRVILWQPWRGL